MYSSSEKDFGTIFLIFLFGYVLTVLSELGKERSSHEDGVLSTWWVMDLHLNSTESTPIALKLLSYIFLLDFVLKS